MVGLACYSLHCCGMFSCCDSQNKVGAGVFDGAFLLSLSVSHTYTYTLSRVLFCLHPLGDLCAPGSFLLCLVIGFLFMQRAILYFGMRRRLHGEFCVYVVSVLPPSRVGMCRTLVEEEFPLAGSFLTL